MFIDFLLDGLREHPHNDAIVWEGARFTCGDIAQRVDHWLADARGQEIVPGSVVVIEGDFSPNSVALFLALTELACIVISHSNVSRKGRDRKDAISQPAHIYRIDGADNVSFELTSMVAHHALFSVLRERKHPGLVLFSSGTSADPKAAVHDFTFLLDKFRTRRNGAQYAEFPAVRPLGRPDTLLHTLSNNGVTVTVRDRSPELWNVCGSFAGIEDQPAVRPGAVATAAVGQSLPYARGQR